MREESFGNSSRVEINRIKTCHVESLDDLGVIAFNRKKVALKRVPKQFHDTHPMHIAEPRPDTLTLNRTTLSGLVLLQAQHIAPKYRTSLRGVA